MRRRDNLRDGRICPSLLLLLFLAFVSADIIAQTDSIPSLVEGHYDNNQKRYEALIDSAEWHANNKRWDEAEVATIEALRFKPASPANWLLWANLGEIRAQKGNLDGAVDAYSIGLNRNPRSIRMLEGRASALMQMGSLSEAEKDLDIILQQDTLREWPRLMRGIIYMTQKRNEKAKQDFTILLSSHPANAQAYLGLARLYAAENKEAEATIAFQKAILYNPDDTTYTYYIAYLADRGKISEAAEELRSAMNKYPRRGNLFLLRAYLHKLSYRNTEAEIDRKLAIEYGADKELIESVLDNFKR